MRAQEYDLSALDEILARAAKAIPSGGELLIYQGGQPIYWKQFGPWPKNRQVPIASGTKWLSAGVIMSLVDEGVLSLDDKASHYLPYMTGEKANITVRQLMSHTSGFGGEFPVLDPCLSETSGTLAECAERLARLPLKIPAGTGFLYSGAGMQIAGRVAEVASGKDWQTLFRERIAEPLEMTATDYEYKGPTQNPRISGGGRSTVSDYMNYLLMLSQGGTFHGKRVLSAEAVRTMSVDQTGGLPIVESPFSRVTIDPKAPFNRYGIGNWLEDVNAWRWSTQNSSLGALGWSPWMDSSRDVQMVFGIRLLMQAAAPFYFEFKGVLQKEIPVLTRPRTLGAPVRP